MQNIISRQDAENLVIDSIEGTGVVEDARVEYDVEGILDHYWDTYTGWERLQDEAPEDFWTVVEQHAR